MQFANRDNSKEEITEMSVNLVLLSKQHAIESAIDLVSDAISKKEIAGYQSSKVHVTAESIGNIEFAKHMGAIRNTAPGDVKLTHDPLDIAAPQGYFQVRTPKGDRYTKNGHFMLSPQGVLQTTEGYSVLNAGGAEINIKNASSVTFGTDGTVSSPTGILGKLKVVNFKDEQELDDKGLAGYFSTKQEEIIPKSLRVTQGALQGSNVDGVKAMLEFTMLTHEWMESHQIQKKHDTFEQNLHDKLIQTNA